MEQWVVIISLILFLILAPILVLLISDIETQKRIIRGYIKQLDRNGGIMNEVTWEQMRSAIFVLPAWFFRIPDRNTRPDIYSYPQITEVILKVRQNWRLIRVIFPIVALLVTLMWWLISDKG
jgi:hypothetical protein